MRRHALDQVAVDAGTARPRRTPRRRGPPSRNSDRNSPMPSAPACARRVDLIEALDVRQEPDRARRRPWPRARRPAARGLRRSPNASRGARAPDRGGRPAGRSPRPPASPSTSTMVPGTISRSAPQRRRRRECPATGPGWPNGAVRLPVSIARPRISAGSSCAADGGASSSATSTRGRRQLRQHAHAACRRRAGGCGAAGRPRRRRRPGVRAGTSSPTSANTPQNSSKARSSAHSALTRSASTMRRARGTSRSSSSISSCASNRLARSAPARWETRARMARELRRAGLPGPIEPRRLAADVGGGDRRSAAPGAAAA